MTAGKLLDGHPDHWIPADFGLPLQTFLSLSELEFYQSEAYLALLFSNSVCSRLTWHCSHVILATMLPPCSYEG